jgi:protein-L-isoaspartate(D-aspartate) O-methyltransferase
VTDIAALRRDYAARMLRIAGVEDAAVARAFAAVPREDFLGAGPWTIFEHSFGAVEVTGEDPSPLYEDVLVALDRARGLNNGSPSLHALMLHHLAVRPGVRVLHVGAGTGYYTAILAELTGPDGNVVAVEHDARLAGAARANLRRWPQVGVLQGDGADWPQDTVDCIYVNFAVTHPAARWVDNLSLGGRLVFPLGVPIGRFGEAHRHSNQGAVLLFTRRPAGIAVSHLTPCAFVCAEGRLADTEASQDALERAFLGGGLEFVRSYLRGPPASREDCWFWSDDWALSYQDVDCPRHASA